MARPKKIPKTKDYVLRVGPQGRIVIPAPMRKALGLKTGDVVVGTVEEDKVILQPRRVVEQELWAMFKDVKRSLSKELISERKEEAIREAEED